MGGSEICLEKQTLRDNTKVPIFILVNEVRRERSTDDSS